MSWQAGSPRRIYVWPDGGWADAREFEDALDGWRGDDEVELVLDEALTDRQVDEAALLAALLTAPWVMGSVVSFEGAPEEVVAFAHLIVSAVPPLALLLLTVLPVLLFGRGLMLEQEEKSRGERTQPGEEEDR